jgi:hypothetical protein
VRTQLLMLLTSVVVTPLVLAQGKNATCGDANHYRWAQKTDTTLGYKPPVAADLAQIVGSWTAPALPADDWCAPRQGNELNTYSIMGWVRVLRAQPDSDWHIEITANAAAPLASCMLVEIPPIRYGSAFATARSQLARALSGSQVTPAGFVRPAVQLRFTGAAFYDGWHLTHGSHGHCNQLPGGLWELHPVYSVQTP